MKTTKPMRIIEPKEETRPMMMPVKADDGSEPIAMVGQTSSRKDIAK